MTWMGLAFIFCAGLLLVYAYLRTGQLWLSIGLHTGWNFFVIVVFFGTPVNSLRLFSLMDTTFSPTIPVLYFFALEFLTLVICSRLVLAYANARKKKISASPAAAS